jgi:hypothetical protein
MDATVGYHNLKLIQKLIPADFLFSLTHNDKLLNQSY